MARRLQTIAAVTCMKTLLMVFNFIFWLTGIAVLAIGIWMKIQLVSYLQLGADASEAVPYIMIGTGSAIIIVGGFACCCTMKGQPVLLYMYGAFLFLVFVIELASGIAGYMYRGKLQVGFHRGLIDSLDKYGTSKLVTTSIDSMQETLECCGANNYTDWYKTPWEKNQTTGQGLVPVSCCVNQEECKPDQAHMDNYYRDGCYEKVVVFLDKHISEVGGSALGVACFQLIGVVLSCLLANNVKKANYEEV